MNEARECLVRGTVQGVGFRPFVFRVARALGLGGWVRNDARGIHIRATGTEQLLDQFQRELSANAPAPALVNEVCRLPATVAGEAESGPFLILDSESEGEVAAPITPDLATCPACVRELFDPTDRRSRYPFINCTHCGPRFSILERIPYDRPCTTMRHFELCAACRAEYDDPANRRFHAQPNACPVCGPRLMGLDEQGTVLAENEEALQQAIERLRAGEIVAVKGVGGFHLMTDARRDESVRRLRRRKQREEKPLAVMFPSIALLRRYCVCDQRGEGALLSSAAPIVLLHKRLEGESLAESVAPGQPRLGALLPYTPLHHLLMRELDFPVVATSGNLSDEPICIDEQDALSRLGGIADFFLSHNRPIARPVDDSVVRVMADELLVLRRSRGYAPQPILIDVTASESVLAVGGHMKNTVALAMGRQVFMSQHVGDLDTAPAGRAFEDAVEMLKGLYRRGPARIVCDLHPDYRSSLYARRSGVPVLSVQHHHAHVAGCMLEHGLRGTVCGVAWDGTGYGADGAVWGGEWLVAQRATYRRATHLRYFRLPGGDRAAREPRRLALSLLHACYGPDLAEVLDLPTLQAFNENELDLLGQMIERGTQSPWTSSAGRLFDAVASLIGLRQIAHFEGQAAMELEALAEGVPPGDSRYSLETTPDGFDWEPMIRGMVADLRAGVSKAFIARAFHQALIHVIIAGAREIGEHRVVLSGGCFQNALLLEGAIKNLRAAGMTAYWPQRIPPNDGGLALGQLAVALGEGTEGVRPCV